MTETPAVEVDPPAPETMTTVLRRSRHSRAPRGRVTLVTLAAVGLWVAIGPEASAASAGSGQSRPSAHAGHRCKCGMDCGATCCCAPDSKHQDAPAPRKPAAPANVLKARPGPCVASAPCGALPTGSGPLDRSSEPADRPAVDPAGPDASRSLLAPPASDRAEALPGSRPDEPPERIADA